MSKPKPYCARTLRGIASRLRRKARALRWYPQGLPGGGGFTRAGVYDNLADDLLNEARAIERKATK